MHQSAMFGTPNTNNNRHTQGASSSSLVDIKREKDLIRAEMERVVAAMQRCEVELNNGTPGKREELSALRDQLANLRGRMKQVMTTTSSASTSSSMMAPGVGAAAHSNETPQRPTGNASVGAQQLNPSTSSALRQGGGGAAGATALRYSSGASVQQHTPREIQSAASNATEQRGSPLITGNVEVGPRSLTATPPPPPPPQPTTMPQKVSSSTTVPVHRYPQQQSVYHHTQPETEGVYTPPPAQIMKLSPARHGVNTPTSMTQQHQQPHRGGGGSTLPDDSFVNPTTTTTASRFISPPKAQRGLSPPTTIIAASSNSRHLETTAALVSQYNNRDPTSRARSTSSGGVGGGVAGGSGYPLPPAPAPPSHHQYYHHHDDTGRRVPETFAQDYPQQPSSASSFSAMHQQQPATGISSTEHHLVGQIRQRHQEEAMRLRSEFERLQAAMDQRHAEEVRQCNDACLEEQRVRREFEESRLRVEQASMTLVRMGQQHQTAATRPAPEVSALSSATGVFDGALASSSYLR